MALHIPSNLKSADISRFALRAAQLEKAKPAIAYWCYYWIVNQVITKGLHNADPESKTFTTALMDKLEQIKAEDLGNDAINDDMAAQAYVEMFALDVFQRADNAVRANKVSKQTADTFLAAATFLDLLQIWGNPEPEIAAKSKYAKYHALRITKALKAGLDPNASNPHSEVLPQQGAESGPRDSDAQSVESMTGARSHSNPVRQPFVEDMQEDVNVRGADMPAASVGDEPLQSPILRLAPQEPTLVPHAAPAPGLDPMDARAFYHGSKENDYAVSPVEPSPADSNHGQIFPGTPSFAAGSGLGNPSAVPPTQPIAPAVSSRPGSSGMPGFTDSNATESLGFQHNPFASQDTRYSVNSPPSHLPPNPPTYPYPSPSPSVPPRQPSQVAPGSVPASSGMNETGTGDVYTVDEQAITEAIKHGKWAISALNFDDVKTAVKEFRAALESLEARR